jgi:hypothetical protein
MHMASSQVSSFRNIFINFFFSFIPELFRTLFSQLWWTAPRHRRWRLTLVRSPTSRVRCQLGRTYNKLIGWDQALYRQRTLSVISHLSRVVFVHNCRVLPILCTCRGNIRH